MILLIDNYDSFTYNLVHGLGEAGLRTLGTPPEMRVVRNDKITPQQALELAPTHLLISPGPCTPEQSGHSREILRAFEGRVPVLGVCLGHQCMGDVGGMTVARHSTPMHGKASEIHHDQRGIFHGLPNPFLATRYHSLVVLEDSIPTPVDGHDGWEVSAWTHDPDGTRVVMGLRRTWADTRRPMMEGVQFHPESFLTELGPRLLENFLLADRPAQTTTETR